MVTKQGNDSSDGKSGSEYGGGVDDGSRELIE